MGFSVDGDRIWPVPPDWSSGVLERLSWRTDVNWAKATAVSQHRGLRIAPRRAFEFEVIANSQDRRVADMLLAGHSGTWLLPVWPDVQLITAPLAAGATEIPCSTAGFDFVAGGRALLFSSVNRWEVVEVDAIEADRLVITEATTGAFERGDRLYPLRRARVQNGAEEKLRSDDLGRRSIAFDIDEACDWPELSAPTAYLGHPVLTVRPDESDDPTSAYKRLIQTVDDETSLPVVHDLPGLALRTQQSHWKLFGREEHSWYRSLLYTLQGRRVPFWVPSWTNDLRPVAAIAGTALVVEWAGYKQFGFAKPNRRDVRIELFDGTVYYRRVADAYDAGATEILTLSSSLSGTSIAAERVRSVSIMALATLASDDVEIDHKTDAAGVATSTTGWQAVVPDV